MSRGGKHPLGVFEANRQAQPRLADDFARPMYADINFRKVACQFNLRGSKLTGRIFNWTFELGANGLHEHMKGTDFFRSDIECSVGQCQTHP